MIGMVSECGLNMYSWLRCVDRIMIKSGEWVLYVEVNNCINNLKYLFFY